MAYHPLHFLQYWEILDNILPCMLLISLRPKAENKRKYLLESTKDIPLWTVDRDKFELHGGGKCMLHILNS